MCLNVHLQRVFQDLVMQQAKSSTCPSYRCVPIGHVQSATHKAAFHCCQTKLHYKSMLLQKKKKRKKDFDKLRPANKTDHLCQSVRHAERAQQRPT